MNPLDWIKPPTQATLLRRRARQERREFRRRQSYPSPFWGHAALALALAALVIWLTQ